MSAFREEVLSDTVRIFLGDCRDVLSLLGRVDAVVTDPPYGIGYRHSGHVGGVAAAIGITKAANKRGSPPVFGDDSPFDPSPWLAFPQTLLWGADHFYPRLPDSGRWLAWNKLGSIEPWDTFCDVEFAWHSKEGPARVFSMLWKGLACAKKGEENGLREHTTQKPIRLMEWCVEQAGDAETILDPFMGSGTTGVACVNLDRKFIGIEREPKYFDIARRRITEALSQPRLAFPEPVKVKQESLL